MRITMYESWIKKPTVKKRVILQFSRNSTQKWRKGYFSDRAAGITRRDLWSRSVNDHCKWLQKHVSLQPKVNLLSPTLANLDRIANVVAPCPIGTSGEIDSAILTASTSPIRSTPHADKTVNEMRDAGASTTTISSIPQASMSLVKADEKLTVNCSAKPKSLRDRLPITTTTATTTRNKTNDPQNINADDDEEIDVERVDEHDPMWRPW